MALLFLALVFIGYAPSYYLRDVVASHRPLLPMSPLVHLHGVVFSLWILLFLAQVGLIAGNRRDLHRTLGMAGAALAVAMVVVGTLTGLQGVARASGPPGIPPLQWLAIPLFDMPFFAILVGSALVLRKNSQAHKRLLLITMIGLMAPAVARMPLPPGLFRLGPMVVSDLLILPLVAWDLGTRRRIHVATVAGAALLLAVRIVPPLIWTTDGWFRFAEWAVALAE
jgi:hypothetical protein